MAELRVQKDIAELAEQRTTSRSCHIYISPLQRDFPIVRVAVSLSIKPDIGHLYSGALFQAVIVFGEKYPFLPPTVIVHNRVYHPNVDIDTGEAFIDLLALSNWKPVITLSSIILALELTFLEPNFTYLPSNPANQDMAVLYDSDWQEFERRVRASLAGGRVAGYDFAPFYGQLATLKRKRQVEYCEKRAWAKVTDTEPMHVDVSRCA